MEITQNSDEELLVKIARLYYFGGLTQQEIANKLNLSRPKVGRKIKKALELGIVEIRMSPDFQSYHYDLETEMEKRFGLREALVLDSSDSKEALIDSLGRAGARYLDRILENDFLLGIGFGTSFSKLVKYLSKPTITGGTIITLSGGFSQPGHDTAAYNSSWPLADKLNAGLEQLFCPLVSESKEARDAINSDKFLKAQFVRATSCDVALVSIGKIDYEMPLHLLGFCTKEDVEQLKKVGAAGEMIASFYDIEGNEVKTDLGNRKIGLGIEELRNIPTTIAISGGLDKKEAILGALQSGCIDVMIVDQATAQAVLDLHDQLIKK